MPKSNPNHRNCWHARRCAPLRSELPCPANVRSSAKGDTRSSTDHVCCACTTGHSTIYETRTSALAKANGRNRPLADVATLGKQTFNVRNKMREPTCQSYAGLLGCWVAGLLGWTPKLQVSRACLQGYWPLDPGDSRLIALSDWTWSIVLQEVSTLR